MQENSSEELVVERRGRLGLITLNRPKALNALTLDMVRRMTATLLQWRDDPGVRWVLVHASSPRAFCAGGDIRFFHRAALAGDPSLDDFFTEEYALNHLIHSYPKPYVAWMEGIVMGGGMGISQGASRRLLTVSSRLAMPETQIGLFPDVGGGWFLSRCPGHVGEFLGLTGVAIGPGEALAWGLADRLVDAAHKPALIGALAQGAIEDAAALDAWLAQQSGTLDVPPPLLDGLWAPRTLDHHFSASTVQAIMDSLMQDDSDFSREVLAMLAKRSPLMLSVTLRLIRHARSLTMLAQELRIERDLMRRVFSLRAGPASEAVEGIRALAIDKDHQPRWQPAQLSGVTEAMVDTYFTSPWPAHAHPLRDLHAVT